jgi:tryptophan halogenase
MGTPLRNITIVGGGTAGWIVAAYLNHRLQWGMTGRGAAVTVIESPEIGTIGVGEATVPTLKDTLRMLQIPEAEFIRRTDATFKLGIWFRDWNRKPDGAAVNFMHPFTGGLTVLGMNPGYSFKRHGFPGRENVTDQDFVRTVSTALNAMEGMRGPRALNGPEFGGALQYAYHLDAGKLAAFLTEVCTARGVRHVRDNVVGVQHDARGYISALQLKEHGEWPVELVIDCTGFRGLLINQAMGEPFESYADYLLNDRAMPIQIPHEDARQLNPVTTTTALGAGWAWNIPLQTRIGTCYVFSSAFASEEAALAEFRAHVGKRAGSAAPRVLKMRVGRTRRSWVKNCVAMGLSSGFVEPLESTAIMTVEMMSRWLLHSLPTTDFEQPLIDQFNTRVAGLYDEVRDFLGLHFSLSNRDDTPYWRAVRHEAKRSDTLREHLALWKHSLPSPINPRPAAVFNSWSVQCILMGKDFYRDAELVGEETVPPAIWRQYIQEIRATRAGVMGRIASHYDLVAHMSNQPLPNGGAVNAARPWQSVVGTGDAMTVTPRPVMDARA